MLVLCHKVTEYTKTCHCDASLDLWVHSIEIVLFKYKLEGCLKASNIVFICQPLLWPEGQPYSNQRVRPSVRPSVRHRLFLLTGSSLCSLLLRNYSTDSSNDDTNQLREQCRCATCTSFWPWPLHDCRSRSQNTSILWIIFADG